jgi:polysaccharide biosynthesis/export protein ExoF
MKMDLKFMGMHQLRRSCCSYGVLFGLVLWGAVVDAGSAQTLNEGALATPAAVAPEAAPEAPTMAEAPLGTVETYEAPSEPQPGAKSANTPEVTGENDAYAIESGDRLKILVYDRPDLTAEYRVSDQGNIRIPTLGTFEAANRSAVQLETAIADALERLLQRPGIVNVDVIERRPVFVTGLVAKPGAYRFTMGMAVIHATALAGGTSVSASASLLPTEALREGSRARTSEEELKHLLAIQARLNSERNESSKIEAPPQLVELAGPERAADLIRDERENMTHRREILDRQVALLNSSIEEAKTEVAAFKKELAKIQEQRTIRETALNTLETLSNKGLTTQQRLTDSQFLLASVDRDAQTAIANIARSQQNLDKAEHDLAVLALERKMSIAKELQDINERIVRAQLSIDGSKKVVGQITGVPSELLGSREPEFRYEILRKGSDGELHTTAAIETTRLQPGDVVRISSPEQTKHLASDTSN